MEYDVRPARRQPPTLGPLPVRLHACQHELFTLHFPVSLFLMLFFKMAGGMPRALWLGFSNAIQSFMQGRTCLSWAQEAACRV